MDRILYDLPFLRAVLKQDNSRREEAINERMNGAAEAIGEKKNECSFICNTQRGLRINQPPVASATRLGRKESITSYLSLLKRPWYLAFLVWGYRSMQYQR